MVSTQLRRQAVGFLKERGLAERRSCVLAGLSRSSLHYVTHPRDDRDLEQRLRGIARKHKRDGYRRALAVLRRDRLIVNPKRVQRLWRKAGLRCPVRKKRLRCHQAEPVPQEARYPDQVWTYDFVFDVTTDGRTLKFLTLLDEYTRECRALEVARRLPAKAVMQVLERVFAEQGRPEYLRSDNGAEFTAPRDPALAEDAERPYARHRTRQSLAEWLWREFQRQVPRRVLEHGAVLERG